MIRPVREIWARLRSLRRRNALEHEMDEELRFHLEMATERNRRLGMPEEEARRQALVAFGGVERHKEDARDESRARWLEDAWSDVRYAVRSLRRSPGFTAASVLVLALGIGATTAVFSVVDGVLLEPLPYPASDRLAVIYAGNPSRGISTANVSYQDYLSWKGEARSFERMAIFNWWSGTLSGGGSAERISGAQVSADVFRVLGVRPLLGRAIAPQEETSGRDRVVVLGYGLWQRRFGGDRSVLGRAVTVDGEPRTVIGVMPPSFRFPYDAEAWIPLPSDDPAYAERSNRFLAGAVARLAPGVSASAATRELAVISRRLEAEYRGTNKGWEAELVPMREDAIGPLGPALELLFGAVGLVLVVVCANLASLLLARGAGRRREVAVRSALGARRGRLVRQFLAEGMVLALMGGVVGVAVASWGSGLLRAALQDRIPAYMEIRPDPRLFLFGLLATVAVAVLSGLLPALRATRVEARAGLKEGGRATAGAGANRLRSALVVAEVALAVVLLSGSTLLVKSMAALQAIRPGFDAAGVLTARFMLPDTRYPGAEERRQFMDRVLERLRATPGVVRVGAAQGTPFSGWNVGYHYQVEGEPPRPPGEEYSTHFQYVTPDFFEVLRVPLVRGRAIGPADDGHGPPVAVVNESFVRRHFAGQDPISRRIRFGPNAPWHTIVGVIADYRHYSLAEPMTPAVYVPFAEDPPPQMTLALRTAGPPEAMVPQLRRVLAQLDPDVPAFRVESLAQRVARQTWVERVARDTLGAFAATAGIVAMIGLYALLAYAVVRRRHELGIRLALGATPPRLLRLVVRQGLVLAAVGIAIGSVAALASARFVGALLYQVKPADPTTFVLVPLLVALMAAAAAYLPARRAARVEPATALREE